MRLLSLALPAILAASVTARSTFFSAKDVTIADDAFKVPGENPLEHCADPKDNVLTVKSIDLSPNPPAAGQKLTVKASGKLSEDVEDGAKVHLTVKYGVIRIISQTADLCETVQNVDWKCPLKKGELTLTKEVNLPAQIPPGKYAVEADVVSKDGNKITCLTGTVAFGSHTASAADAGNLLKQDI